MEQSMSEVRPDYYSKLPDGVRCRCIHLWAEVDGSHWCCNANKAPEPVRLDDAPPLQGKRSYEMDEALLAKEKALLKDIKKLHTEPQPVKITDAMVDAGLKGWFSVKPSAAESDAVLERSMRAALERALAVTSQERNSP
jgi:hypothetical protein